MLPYVDPMLTLCWPKLPPSCPYVDPMFAYVGRGNALPHSSDRNGGGGDGVGRGWERGWNGVETGESAVGAARLYNLRLPPKASGKDTGCGCWPAPGYIQELTHPPAVPGKRV